MTASRFQRHACALTTLTTSLVLLSSLYCEIASAEPIVPGTGRKITTCGDDFERGNWRYFPNYPKSSRNLDEQERAPLGKSANGRWLEGPHRGTPDIMRRIPTPDNGLKGSDYSLLMRSTRPGVPGRPSNEPQQDDMMVKVKRRIGHPIPAEWSPNCVVRVFVPPFEDWEDRTGASFGFRTDCWGRKPDQKEDKLEQFWPGVFFNFRSRTSRNISRDSAHMKIRSDARGRDMRGPDLAPGWWTLGLSISPDGMCHYYARQGTGDLTDEDHLGSYFCYGYRVERMDLFFFNIVTQDDGRSISTPWIVDDPEFYCTVPRSYNQRAGHAGNRSNQVRHATNSSNRSHSTTRHRRR